MKFCQFSKIQHLKMRTSSSCQPAKSLSICPYPIWAMEQWYQMGMIFLTTSGLSYFHITKDREGQAQSIYLSSVVNRSLSRSLSKNQNGRFLFNFGARKKFQKSKFSWGLFTLRCTVLSQIRKKHLLRDLLRDLLTTPDK